MTLHPLFLSRLQWTWVISWHILLPAFTVALAAFTAVLEGLAFFTRHATPVARRWFSWPNLVRLAPS